MNRTITRIAAKAVAPLVGIGMLAGAVGVFAAAAPASAAPAVSNQGPTCSTSTGVTPLKANATNALTRAGQLAASGQKAPSAPTSCIGH